jgi:hypothetical protein
MPLSPEVDHVWPVRVRRTDEGLARAYARTHAFGIGSQASLRESDPHPAAVEYAAAALGGDLVCGFHREVTARRLAVDAVEVALSVRLDNVLVHIGVVGEEGHAGFGAIEGALFVATAEAEDVIRAAWLATLERSPLHTTLSRATRVEIALRIMP